MKNNQAPSSRSRGFWGGGVRLGYKGPRLRASDSSQNSPIERNEKHHLRMRKRLLVLWVGHLAGRTIPPINPKWLLSVAPGSYRRYVRASRPRAPSSSCNRSLFQLVTDRFVLSLLDWSCVCNNHVLPFAPPRTRRAQLCVFRCGRLISCEQQNTILTCLCSSDERVAQVWRQGLFHSNYKAEIFINIRHCFISAVLINITSSLSHDWGLESVLTMG